MNFLRFGMKYENSSSKMLRFVARHILRAERRRADRYETRVNKKHTAAVPYSAGSAALLRSILDEIAERFPEEKGTGGGQDA